MIAVEIRELSVRVDRSVLVDNVTLDITSGTWTTVIGPNGAGKTTLVEAVAGVRRTSHGTVIVAGRNVHELRERERARMLAFVPQHPVVPGGMSVARYVGLGRTSHQGLLTVETVEGRDVVDGVISRMGLRHMADRDVSTLSGGERQRAVLARALAQSTRLVVLDEPTTGLDVRHQVEMLELLRREVDECELTVIATLHDLTLAARYGDRLALMNESRLVLSGSVDEVLESHQLADAYGVRMRVVDVDGNKIVVPVVDPRV